ncbi:MAG: bacillithiol biosynthesis cysteine-adding enzyme BshC [Bdellovibrionales bacterium]|nr:bacillithiol biosynthesis cysteine-adding enzyme BshC [Bdellovibrionales bacterium]
MQISEAYYQHDNRAAELLGGSFLELSDRKAKSDLASAKPISNEVLALLLEQNERALSGPKGSDLKQKLSSPDVQFVISGQQTGLFLGPLFTLYKALGAVKYAELFEAETGKPTVPLFWIQSEDHDYDEIRSAPTLLPDGTISNLALPEEKPADARKSMSAIVLDGSAAMLIETVADKFSSFPESKWFLNLAAKGYRPGSTLSAAFTSLLSDTLSELGLLVFNPCCGKAKQLTQELYQRAFEQHGQITRLLQEQGNRIEQLGFEQQVHIRDNSPLFFFHEGSASGPRYRLQNGGDSWNLVGTDKNISNAELGQLLASSPDRFSSSALLRPLVQDYLFPTVAYIGGDAEVNYLAQLTTLYEFLEIPKPLAIPRPKFVVIEEKIARLLEKTGLQVEDLYLPEPELLSKAATSPEAQYTDPELLFLEVEKSVGQLSDRLAEELMRADKTLETPVRKTQEKMLHQLGVLKQRYIKAVGANDTLLQDRLRKLRTAISPEGHVQERYLSAVYFLCRYGTGFIDTLLEAAEPFATTTKVVNL